MGTETARHGEKAIVIGASMAGLLAARALADHFEQVVLLERDRFPATGENRKGVPQGRHTHVLLERGRKIMERFLPGLTAELERLGAVRIVDSSAQIAWFHGGGYHRRGRGGPPGTGVSRPVLEAAVRQRVLALPNVQAMEGCNVLELVGAAGNRRVGGVRLQRRTEGGAEETLQAELVVDVSGRGSRSPSWLEALGYERPGEEEVRIGMGYTTCYYRREPGQIPGLEGIVLMPTPPNRRLGVLLAQEGSRWVVTVGGYQGENPAPDAAEFLNAARQLPDPAIYEVIKDAELLRAPAVHNVPTNLRRRYDRLVPFPEGYLVLGDALCSFNPIYAQGMTVAALEAVALDETLAQGQEQLASRFFARANKIVDDAWNTAVGTDLAFPEVEGRRSPPTRFLNWYIGKLHRAAHHDAQVSIAFLKVINMVAPPPTILHPRIVWRVLKGNLGWGRPRLGQDERRAASQRVGMQQ